MPLQPVRLLWRCLPILVLPLGCGNTGTEAEHKAAAFVEKLGGTVNRDFKAPGQPVVTVEFAGPEVNDVALKELAALKNLKKLVTVHHVFRGIPVPDKPSDG